MNKAVRIWASIVSLSIIAQVGLAAYGAFHAVKESDDKGSIGKNAVSDGFTAHSAFGYVILLEALVLVLLAFAARRSGRPGRLRWSGIILGLIVVQILLAGLGDSVPWLGVLHGMNALAVAGVAGSFAGREWAGYRGARAPAPQP